MQKLLSQKSHGLIDYATVVLFASSPILFNLEGVAAGLALLLAAVHLLMTALTGFSYSVAKLIPFKLHGAVELVVALALVSSGLLYFEAEARTFFTVIGAVIFLVWLTTNYGSSKTHEKHEV